MRPKFNLFDKLPRNVQSMIWEEACYFPNILQTEIYYSFPEDENPLRNTKPELLDSALERTWLPAKIFYNVPAVLHTCFESRRIALRIYDQVGNPFRAEKIYMNREVDIMFYDDFGSTNDAYALKTDLHIRAHFLNSFPKHDYTPHHILINECWDELKPFSIYILQWMPGLKTVMSRSGGTCKTEDFKHELILYENDEMPTLHFLTAEQIDSMRPKGPAPPVLLHPNIPSEYLVDSRVYSRLRILPSWAEPHFKVFQQELQELSNSSRNLRSQRIYIPPFDHPIWLSLERIRRYKLEYYRLRSLFDNSADKYHEYDYVWDTFQSGNSIPSIGTAYNWDKWAEGTVEGGAFPYKHPYWQDDLRNDKWTKDTVRVLYKHTPWENRLRQRFRKLPNREKARLYTLAWGSALGWIRDMGRKSTGAD